MVPFIPIFTVDKNKKLMGQKMQRKENKTVLMCYFEQMFAYESKPRSYGLSQFF